MYENYEKVQPWILAHEGGYVNHPRDPGGATNEGVTQRTYDAYRRRYGKPTRSVRDMAAAERDTIYRLQYWDKVMGNDLPSGVDYAVYDFAVNSGPARAVKYVQKIVGAAQDGIMGLQTLAAIRAYDPEKLVVELCLDRMAFLRRLSHWPTFKNGWTRRVVGKWDGVQDGDHGVIDRAAMLARGARDIPAPKITKDGSGAKADGTVASPWAGILSLVISLFRSTK